MQTIKDRLRALLPLVLAAVGLLSGCRQRGDRVLLDGVKSIEAGHYSEAIVKLNKATSLLPTNAVAWNALGLAYQYSGEFSSAESAYNRALNFDRDMAEARFNLGCVLLEQNKGEAARSQFTTYLLRRGPSPEVLLKLGSAQLRVRDVSGAEKNFQEALRLSPQNAEALNGLGLVKIQRGRFQEASQYFLNARKADPLFAPALLNLAIVKHQNLRDRASALQDYREYVSLKPPPPDAEAVSAVLRSLEFELSPSPRSTLPPPPVQTNVVAITQKPPALNTNVARLPATGTKPEPTSSATKTQVAQSLIKVGPTSTPAPLAVEKVTVPDEPVIKSAQDISIPPRETVKAGTSAVSETTSQNQETAATKPAKRTFLQSINPMNLFHNQNGATGQTARGTTNFAGSAPPSVAAKTSTEDALLLDATRYQYTSLSMPAAGNRTEAERAFSRGLAAQTGRKYSQAVEAYREAVRLDPAFFEAYYNLALTYSRQNNPTAAMPAYEKALAIRPDSADARYNFALLLMGNRFTQDAINEFEKVIAAHPTEARAHLALGNIYSQELHQPAKAKVHYRRVIEIDPRHPQANAIALWLKANP